MGRNKKNKSIEGTKEDTTEQVQSIEGDKEDLPILVGDQTIVGTGLYFMKKDNEYIVSAQIATLLIKKGSATLKK